MTEELLTNANAIRNRIIDVTNLLESLDLTDPSGYDTVPRISPIVLHAGMAQTIQFDVLPNDVDKPITEMQRLDAKMHEFIVKLLKDYKRQLDEMFDKLA